MPKPLIQIATEVRRIIERADSADIALDDGNIIDLLADNLESEPLDTLRDALVVAGMGSRFPHAVRRHTGD